MKQGILSLALVALAGCGGPPEEETGANANGVTVRSFDAVYRNWSADGTAEVVGDVVQVNAVFTCHEADGQFVGFIADWRWRPAGQGTMNATCSDATEGTVPCTVTAWFDGVMFLDMDDRKDFPPHRAKPGMTVTISATYPRQLAQRAP